MLSARRLGTGVSLGITSTLLLMTCAGALAAQPSFRVPALTGPVVDQIGLLSRGEHDALAQALRQLHAGGGSQIAVLIASTLGGLTIEQASIKVTDHWKLGSKDKDNGVLLFVAPKERRVRIEVGQGLEGDLPDAYASRIIEEVITPQFRQKRFAAGIMLGVAAIVKHTDPKVDFSQLLRLPAASAGRSKRHRGSKLGPLLFALIAIFVLGASRSRGGRGGRRGGGWFIGPGIGGGFGGGGFGGGGFGGGGFSGGGGGFSGGGASGGW